MVQVKQFILNNASKVTRVCVWLNGNGLETASLIDSEVCKLLVGKEMKDVTGGVAQTHVSARGVCSGCSLELWRLD